VSMYALPTRGGLLQKVCSDTWLFKNQLHVDLLKQLKTRCYSQRLALLLTVQEVLG